MKGIRMKLVVLICAASLLFLIPSIASAEGAGDLSHGNSLFAALSSCPATNTSSYGKEHSSDADFHDCIFAKGYIKGAIEAMTFAAQDSLSIPAGVTYGQEYEIIYIYLKNHVNQRQQLSVYLIRDALVEAFPPPNR